MTGKTSVAENNDQIAHTPGHNHSGGLSHYLGRNHQGPAAHPRNIQENAIQDFGDARFVRLGLRRKGEVGEHDRQTRFPLPDHISARPDNLASLIDGLIAFDRESSQKVDAVFAAAVLAFGFIYIRPFEDGNARIHRYLIHHVLAQRGINLQGWSFRCRPSF